MSSYVEPGTVFRASEGEQPYDHTSILATLRDWLHLSTGPDEFLPSPRIVNAPTLDRVLTRMDPNTNWPDAQAHCVIDNSDVNAETPLSDLQRNLLAASKVQNQGVAPEVAKEQVKQLRTYAHAGSYMAPFASS